MSPGTFESFKTQAHAQGFDQVLERVWPPSAAVDTHTHPFSISAVIVSGEMWLTVAGHERHLRPGDTFTLDREVPHSERYGTDGTTLWVARRNG
jgi:quercetin dioxygenase-like cupin family protein